MERKTDGSIYALNKLHADELGDELKAMTENELIATCMKAIWSCGMLEEVVEENK